MRRPREEKDAKKDAKLHQEKDAKLHQENCIRKATSTQIRSLSGAGAISYPFLNIQQLGYWPVNYRCLSSVW